ncbi:DUF6233 domain-containing protein [Streptomyces sp. NPDC059863]|uniref:DUF6233 domain-containing protein n=1 Tax=unclassified Streptomyces TaxID=2593676 RepID=UPI003653A6DC
MTVTLPGAALSTPACGLAGGTPTDGGTSCQVSIDSGHPGPSALLLHRADCWVAEGRLTPANATEAAAFVWHGWVTGCNVWEPVP